MTSSYVCGRSNTLSVTIQRDEIWERLRHETCYQPLQSGATTEEEGKEMTKLDLGDEVLTSSN